MKQIMKWIHLLVCVFSTFALIGIANSHQITKDQFIGAFCMYTYMICLLITLFKKDY